MSNQPHGGDAHDPIFKVHRHPLAAVKSIAAGLTSSGGCRNPSERRWDARAWNCATRFVPLPVPREAIDAQMTCGLDRSARLKLALHYWVKWNLLADRWSQYSFAVETVTAIDVLQHWCGHCMRTHTCVCPASAELAILSAGGTSNATAGQQSSEEQRLLRKNRLMDQLPDAWQRQRLQQSGSDAKDARVRRRKGHGKRKGPPLTWETLASIDQDMTRVAKLLAQEYGYGLSEPVHVSSDSQSTAPAS